MSPARKRKPASKRPTAEMCQELEKSLEAEPPVSVATAAQIMKTTPRELHGRCGDICQAITARRQARISEDTVNQRLTRLESVRVVVSQLVQEGELTTRRRIEARLEGVPKFFLSVESMAVAAICKSVKKEFRFGSGSPRAKLRTS